MRAWTWMFGALLLAARPAAAAPIVIEANLAAVPPRSDEGTGICASAVHLKVDDRFDSFDIARAFLDMPTDSQVNGTKTDIYPAINFRNSLAAGSGDFTGAGSNEATFPFSATMSMPEQPNDNNNFAMRVRGYLNITRAGVHTFAVNADDAFQLFIGGKEIMRTTALGTGQSLRYSRQVDFKAPGLFFMEIIYFQNSGPAALEMSLSDRPDDTEFGPAASVGPNFKLLQGKQLYSALASKSDCKECVNDAICGSGKYCRDRLCQRCVLPTHCGSDCGSCTPGQPVCTSDTKTAAEACKECGVSATGVVNVDVCKARKYVCDFATNQCVPCLADTQCDEKAGEICDLAFGQCIPRPNLKYAGGCSTGGRSASTGGLALLGLAALLLVARRRQAAR